MLSQVSGVYAIVCAPLDKMYIGSSVNMRNREYLHNFDLKRNIHKNKPLQRAYNILGAEHFTFKEVEQCSKENVKQAEQKWLDKFATYLFNRCPSAFSPKGVKHTEETKLKFSAAHKTRPPVSEETRAKLSAALKRRPPPSEETREKIRLSKLGNNYGSFKKKKGQVL